MPRRRPGALRAEQSPRIAWSLPPDRIHGLSTRTSVAIDQVERLSGDYYLYPGATDRALRRYRAFLQAPGRRPLYPQDAECSCRGCSFDDVRHARDVLEEVVRQLPSRPHAELQQRVRALDARYMERTLPDPFAVQRQSRSDSWWRRRLAGGREAG
ncbi:hypothetical protein [Streptomyces bluensis]|uniref:hypothetical protein n=1 Tax=Streptomyces bluensis TaxID=33897 RepID=UPI0019CE629B|nr:hypothetical protein [Streptomyces bluensis]GGZ87193.1 hypothetical protein GCM10010344_63460 [Streptomyces bluensis]